MRLVGQRVLIRDFTLTDAPDYLAYAGDLAVCQPAGMQAVLDEQTAKKTLQRFALAHSDFAIVYAGRVIGNIGIYPRVLPNGAPDLTTKEIGYALAQAYWGQGLMAEAVALVCAHLFAQGIQAIWAAVFPDNQRSIALLQRQGFCYQFTVPLPAGLALDAPRDEAYYRLLPNG
ncbi:GNAT family N-acetyltransferase [Lacticaseibacillus baoqingensis]|uniref:GNAT family N-acetyltransferase n=1 Tax=Lacticaseibacillus baoqingensis TaxID=2486013 RepID=A0ABW4E4C5_9LACO|nr:GNAT family N-acetyltransferase [Lacticaseibacillus baoqingensis]